MKTELAAGGRDAFTTSLGVLAATLGSAVGLGNIWKFPVWPVLMAEQPFWFST